MCSPVSSVPCILCTFFSVSRLPVSVSGCQSQVSGILDCLLLGPSQRPIYHQPGSVSGSGMTPESPWTVVKFQVSLQGNKSHENCFQGHPKSWKLNPRIMRNPISAKDDFRNTSLATCLAFQCKTPKFRLSNHKKKQPGNRYDNLIFFSPKVPKRLSKWAHKSTKNQ